jgi:hypothetical protein
MSNEIAICQLCGEPMPEGEEVFNYHGYSGPCPVAPLKNEPMKCPCMYWARTADTLHDSGHHPKCDGTGHHKSFTARPDEGDKEWELPLVKSLPCDKCGALATAPFAANAVVACAKCFNNAGRITALESQLAAERTRREQCDEILALASGITFDNPSADIVIDSENEITALVNHPGIRIVYTGDSVYEAFRAIQDSTNKSEEVQSEKKGH